MGPLSPWPKDHPLYSVFKYPQHRFSP